MVCIPLFGPIFCDAKTEYRIALVSEGAQKVHSPKSMKKTKEKKITTKNFKNHFYLLCLYFYFRSFLFIYKLSNEVIFFIHFIFSQVLLLGVTRPYGSV